MRDEERRVDGGEADYHSAQLNLELRHRKIQMERPRRECKDLSFLKKTLRLHMREKEQASAADQHMLDSHSEISSEEDEERLTVRFMKESSQMPAWRKPSCSAQS
ncbi:hypothetical protein DNTS_027219 [Danionella cerebrum]|uniref:Uncharacterized protein n=1 Tax=Danionella cerebrum TaxID=2873325 RepID=A0A553QNY8_9TELE|nr:hypothetical protein DNTS_027219 [Danionella translucida]